MQFLQVFFLNSLKIYKYVLIFLRENCFNLWLKRYHVRVKHASYYIGIIEMWTNFFNKNEK